MLKKLYTGSSVVATDLVSFQRQESLFIILNLVLLPLLVLMHSAFAGFWGKPSLAVVTAVGLAFLLRILELIWVRSLSRPLTVAQVRVLTWSSIVFNLMLATLLSDLANHDDNPYFVLMVVPVLESAFRFSLPAVFGVVWSAGLLNFFEVWHYFVQYPPLDVAEYVEAGTISILFAIVGVLVWALVNFLRRKEEHLAANLLELERTREKLLQEETLAAVGRLSSAIAHEIRNPVAMISSSLATAARGGLDSAQREEMCEIAAMEAARLEKLTDDLLTYARPRPPEMVATPVADTLAYIASLCCAHAGEKGVQIRVDADESLIAHMDPGQVQQALLNLVMNAVEAAPDGGTICLRIEPDSDHKMRINVENSGAAIPPDEAVRIFEPFFTTRIKGTGLGLAIARNIARAHGGDLVLTSNSPQRVCFSLILPMSQASAGVTAN